jgi:RNA polymerase sigma factor (sigma-70 family)
MAKAPLAAVLHHLRLLAAAQPDRDLSDAELLERFRRQREETAFAILLQRHGPMVLSVCRRVLHNPHDAEDAFQATFLALVRSAGSIRKGQSLASWLYGVAQRVATKARKQAASRRTREQRGAAMPRIQPIDVLAWQELRPILDEELATLPEKYRAPLVLCYLEGKTCERAAQDLGVARSTVSGRLKQGLLLLRNRLAERGIELSAGLLAALLCGEAATAAVPDLLTIATVRAATLVMGGRAVAAGLVSSRILTLAQGVTMSIASNKVKFGVVIVLLIGVLAIGGGVAALRLSDKLSAAGSQASPEPPTVSRQAGQVTQPGDENTQAAQAEAEEPPFILSGRESAVLPTTKPAVFVALDPSAKVLTTATSSGELTLWDVTNRKAGEPRHLPGAQLIGLSPDGAVAVTAAGRAVSLLEAATGRTMATLETAGPPPGAAKAYERETPGEKFNPVMYDPDLAVLSPDQRAVALRCRNLEVWSLAGAKPQRIATITHEQHDQGGPFFAPSFSPDGARLAFVGLNVREGLSVWNLAQQRRTLHCPPPYDPGNLSQANTPSSIVGMRDAAFTPDGKTVVVGGSCYYGWTDGSGQQSEARVCWLRAYDAATGAEKYTHEYRAGKDDEADIVTVAVSPDGKVLAAGSRDGRVKLFLASSGRELGAVQSAVRGDYSVALSADARALLTVGTRIRVFELTKEPAPVARPAAPADAWKAPAPEKPSPGELAYRDLLQQYISVRDDMEKKALALPTDNTRQQLIDDLRSEAGRQLRTFARRFLELAEKYSDEPVAAKALTWVAFTLGHGPELDKAVERLVERLKVADKNAAALFVQLRPDVAPVALFVQLRSDIDPHIRTLLRAFAKHGPTREIRAQASFKLAKSLLALAEAAGQLQAEKSGAAVLREWEAYRPMDVVELVKLCRAQDPKALVAEAEALLKAIADSDVPHPYVREETLGTGARWELEELRNPTFAVGKVAPEIEGTDAEGKSFKLSDYRGKVVVLTFSANWCGACRAMYPQERKLVEQLQARPFALLSVSADQEKKTLEESVQKGEITWRCWWDGLEGPIARQWHIEGYPTVFVLDTKGVIRFKHLGQQDKALDQAVNELLQESQRE